MPSFSADEPGVAQRDVGVDDLLHFLEAVIGRDDDRRAVAQAGALERIEQVADQAVGVRESGVAGDACRGRMW